jgi:16S rRNA G966 N2-methylase RsmD
MGAGRLRKRVLLFAPPLLAFQTSLTRPSGYWRIAARAKHSLNSVPSIDNSQERDRAPASNLPSRVCVCQGVGHSELTTSLASTLSLPLFSSLDECFHHGYTHALSAFDASFDDYSIGIQPLLPLKPGRKKNDKLSKINPVIVDLCPPRSSGLGRRTAGASGTKDLLIRAVSPKKSTRDSGEGANILDLTAGFAQDALILANSGARKVQMVERDPIVASLLQDALRRLERLATNSLVRDSDPPRSVAASRLQRILSFKHADGRKVAEDIAEESRAGFAPEDDLPDVVYLDPMFPVRQKSASVKKNMSVLHDLLGSQVVPATQDEEQQLLRAACSLARHRVVVKRPIHAEPLSDCLRPNRQVVGSTNRWDIYYTT